MEARHEHADDDEVQFLYEKHAVAPMPDPIICDVCGKDITSQSVEQRTAHLNVHFDDGSQDQATEKAHKSKKSFSYKNIASRVRRHGRHSEQKNVFWYPALACPPPDNFSPGLVPVISKALRKSHERGQTERAWLCDSHVVHIETEWDKDKGWGCGYRNFLMACTALMSQTSQPEYRTLLEKDSMPGVRNLQCWIEDAWKEGFDAEGAEHFKRHLIDTRDWIGTADIFTAFAFRRIPSKLVDFELPPAATSKGSDVRLLIDWIMRYFSAGESPSTLGDALKSGPVVATNKMPLILQHKGHSRTVVGIERVKKDVINLLMFDPSQRIARDIRDAGLAFYSPQSAPGAAERTNTLGRMLHAAAANPLKRKASDDPKASRIESSKRMRAGQGSKDAIVIDNDEHGEDVVEEHDENTTQEKVDGRSGGEEILPAATVLKVFRVTKKDLAKKDKYQVLYFPLDAPLNDEERWERRVVTSFKIS